MRYANFIIIDGGTESQQKYAISMIMFFKEKFDIDPYIEVCFRGQRHSLGGCIQMEEGEYRIDLDRSARLKTMLTTLAHDLVHVKQYECGELTQNSEDNIPYWDKPSEIEAYGREVGLFITWVEENNLGNKAWTQRC